MVGSRNIFFLFLKVLVWVNLIQTKDLCVVLISVPKCIFHSSAYRFIIFQQLILKRSSVRLLIHDFAAIVDRRSRVVSRNQHLGWIYKRQIKLQVLICAISQDMLVSIYVHLLIWTDRSHYEHCNVVSKCVYNWGFLFPFLTMNILQHLGWIYKCEINLQAPIWPNSQVTLVSTYADL